MFVNRLNGLALMYICRDIPIDADTVVTKFSRSKHCADFGIQFYVYVYSRESVFYFYDTFIVVKMRLLLIVFEIFNKILMWFTV